MVATTETIAAVEDATGSYKYGFVTDIETEKAPKGLNEDVIRFISAKKDEPEWMLEWRLKAYRYWQKMPTPNWAKLNIAPIDYQDIYFYAAPKSAEGPSHLMKLTLNCCVPMKSSAFLLMSKRCWQGLRWMPCSILCLLQQHSVKSYQRLA